MALSIATIAMPAGIGGAVMVTPFFMLVSKLDPLLALGVGLAIEVWVSSLEHCLSCYQYLLF